MLLQRSINYSGNENRVEWIEVNPVILKQIQKKGFSISRLREILRELTGISITIDGITLRWVED